MKTVAEAFEILENNIPNKEIIEVLIENAFDLVLAEEIVCPLNMPPFRQSAMDGFAINLHNKLTYKLVGETKAGDSNNIDLQKGEASWIFTGAAVPNNANAVIQVEKTVLTDNILTLTENPSENTNIRPIGEQISKGDIALTKGTVLNAGAIGFLAGLGITKVKVYSKPKIGIIVTGNELVERGLPLNNGQIYESNGIMLEMALIQNHYKTINQYKVKDNLTDTQNTLAKALSENDFIIISGGISVGNYDFVEKALKALQVEILFYKVKQQPGKPLCTGKINNQLIFALPGNPAASLTCMYVYVMPVLERISGKQNILFNPITKKLSHNKLINNPRDQFFKAKVTNNEVELLSHQASSMLSSFATSNALVYIPAGNYEINAGDDVKVIMT